MAATNGRETWAEPEASVRVAPLVAEIVVGAEERRDSVEIAEAGGMSPPKPMPGVTGSIAVKPQAWMRPVVVPWQCPVGPMSEFLRGEKKGSQEGRLVQGQWQERECLVPIGDEGLGFRRNAVAGEHVDQAVVGEGWNTRGADQVDWDDGRRGRK